MGLEQICGIDTGVHKGHVGHGKVGGAGGVHQNLAVEQSAGQVGQLQDTFRGCRARAGQSRLVATTEVHQLEGDGSKHRLLARLLTGDGSLLLNPSLLLVKVGHNILPPLHGSDSILNTHAIKRSGGFSGAFVVLSLVLPPLVVLPLALLGLLSSLGVLPPLRLVLVSFLQPLLLGPLPLPQSLPLPPGSLSIRRPGNTGGSKLLRETALLMVLSRGENSEGDKKAEENKDGPHCHLPSSRC